MAATKGHLPSPRETKGIARGDKAPNQHLTGAASTHAFPKLAGRRAALCRRLQLTASERAQLLAWAAAPTSPQRLVIRSRIVLLASEGLLVSTIAERLDVSPATVRLWCDRVRRIGVGALPNDAPGRGRRPGMSAAMVDAVLAAMQERTNGAPPWTARSLAARAGTSASTVWRVWKRTRLGPTSPAAVVARVRAQLIAETAITCK
jgi:transposase